MTSSGTNQPPIGDDLTDALFEAILEQLRVHRHFDAGAYKDRCIRRRVAKRLRASGARDATDYLERLAVDDDELDNLLATLSVHVSQFFRNPDAFRLLEQRVLPDLCRLAREAGRKELHLWSVGCAGGEEPYSLALLIDELAPAGLDVSILATDVSEPALEEARAALYDPARLAEVPAAVLTRYFTPEGRRYRLNEQARRMVRFERHNVITAPAFPAAELILCRNVLIYFTREEQARILARFAAVLPEGGALVLGRGETLGGPERTLFRAEFPTERIYRRTAVPTPAGAGGG